MSDTKSTDMTPVEPYPTVQDREVVFQITGLKFYPKEQEQEFRRWVEDGKFVISEDWTKLLNSEALRVAAVRRVVAQQVVVEVTDDEWQKLRWAATRTVDGEPRLQQLNEILALRGSVEHQTLEAAYALVEQDLIQCGVSSIVHKLTEKRAHSSWSARVYSELRTVELPGDVSLYEVINGSMAQAYRARSYDFSMTAEEREAQRRSFAFGNANVDNPDVTRELVDEVAIELQKEKQDE